jgi:exodeoxyribonuclease-3
MRIATFNINGVKARIQALCDWLDEAKPDVALLQEIKSVDEAFPREALEDRGYNVETHGQKGFNGVAILSKLPLEDVSRGLPGDDSDEQARWIEATVTGDGRGAALRALPAQRQPRAGAEIRLQARLDGADAQPCGGASEGRDAGGAGGRLQRHPARRGRGQSRGWRADALALPQSRAAFRRLLNLGYTEAIRARTAAKGLYSFWDYQAGAWDRDNGIRIDHLLLSPQAADLMTDAGIDRHVRGREKPSDHVPVWIDLAA